MEELEAAAAAGGEGGGGGGGGGGEDEEAAMAAEVVRCEREEAAEVARAARLTADLSQLRGERRKLEDKGRELDERETGGALHASTTFSAQLKQPLRTLCTLSSLKLSH